MTARRSVGQVLPKRLRPYLDGDNRAFWTGGSAESLMIHRCQSCHRWFHPPAPICRYCQSTEVAPQQASGRAVLASYTVNYQQWIPDAGPYIIGWVELIEQPGLRLVTNLVEVEAEALTLDMPLEAVFEQHPDGDIWYPLFRPATEHS
jgi:uncharacterized OB-fold protein